MDSDQLEKMLLTSAYSFWTSSFGQQLPKQVTSFSLANALLAYLRKFNAQHPSLRLFRCFPCLSPPRESTFKFLLIVICHLVGEWPVYAPDHEICSNLFNTMEEQLVSPSPDSKTRPKATDVLLLRSSESSEGLIREVPRLMKGISSIYTPHSEAHTAYSNTFSRTSTGTTSGTSSNMTAGTGESTVTGASEPGILARRITYEQFQRFLRRFCVYQQSTVQSDETDRDSMSVQISEGGESKDETDSEVDPVVCAVLHASSLIVAAVGSTTPKDHRLIKDPPTVHFMVSAYFHGGIGAELSTKRLRRASRRWRSVPRRTLAHRMMEGCSDRQQPICRTCRTSRYAQVLKAREFASVRDGCFLIRTSRSLPDSFVVLVSFSKTITSEGNRSTDSEPDQEILARWMLHLSSRMLTEREVDAWNKHKAKRDGARKLVSESKELPEDEDDNAPAWNIGDVGYYFSFGHDEEKAHGQSGYRCSYGRWINRFGRDYPDDLESLGDILHFGPFSSVAEAVHTNRHILRWPCLFTKHDTSLPVWWRLMHHLDHPILSVARTGCGTVDFTGGLFIDPRRRRTDSEPPPGFLDLHLDSQDSSMMNQLGDSVARFYRRGTIGEQDPLRASSYNPGVQRPLSSRDRRAIEKFRTDLMAAAEAPCLDVRYPVHRLVARAYVSNRQGRKPIRSVSGQSRAVFLVPSFWRQYFPGTWEEPVHLNTTHDPSESEYKQRGQIVSVRVLSCPSVVSFEAVFAILTCTYSNVYHPLWIYRFLRDVVCRLPKAPLRRGAEQKSSGSDDSLAWKGEKYAACGCLYATPDEGDAATPTKPWPNLIHLHQMHELMSLYCPAPSELGCSYTQFTAYASASECASGRFSQSVQIPNAGVLRPVSISDQSNPFSLFSRRSSIDSVLSVPEDTVAVIRADTGTRQALFSPRNASQISHARTGPERETTEVKESETAAPSECCILSPSSMRPLINDLFTLACKRGSEMLCNCLSSLNFHSDTQLKWVNMQNFRGMIQPVVSHRQDADAGTAKLPVRGFGRKKPSQHISFFPLTSDGSLSWGLSSRVVGVLRNLEQQRVMSKHRNGSWDATIHPVVQVKQEWLGDSASVLKDMHVTPSQDLPPAVPVYLHLCQIFSERWGHTIRSDTAEMLWGGHMPVVAPVTGFVNPTDSSSSISIGEGEYGWKNCSSLFVVGIPVHNWRPEDGQELADTLFSPKGGGGDLPLLRITTQEDDEPPDGLQLDTPKVRTTKHRTPTELPFRFPIDGCVLLRIRSTGFGFEVVDRFTYCASISGCPLTQAQIAWSGDSGRSELCPAYLHVDEGTDVSLPTHTAGECSNSCFLARVRRWVDKTRELSDVDGTTGGDPRQELMRSDRMRGALVNLVASRRRPESETTLPNEDAERTDTKDAPTELSLQSRPGSMMGEEEQPIDDGDELLPRRKSGLSSMGSNLQVFLVSPRQSGDVEVPELGSLDLSTAQQDMPEDVVSEVRARDETALPLEDSFDDEHKEGISAAPMLEDVTPSEENDQSPSGIALLSPFVLANVFSYLKASFVFSRLTSVCRKWLECVYGPEYLGTVRRIKVSSLPSQSRPDLCVAILSQCVRLKVCSWMDVDDFLLALLGRHCHRLRSLSLSKQSQVSDFGVMQIFQGCPTLCDLDLSHCEMLTDLSLYHAAVSIGRSLRYLNLSFTKNFSAKMFGVLLTHAPKLKQLELVDQYMLCTVYTLTVLGDCCHELQSLNLGLCGVKDEELMALVGTADSTAKMLSQCMNTAHRRHTSSHVEKKLSDVSLAGKQDAGSVDDSAGMPRVISITLENLNQDTPVFVEGMTSPKAAGSGVPVDDPDSDSDDPWDAELGHSIRLPALEALNLFGCERISDMSMRLLTEQLPSLRELGIVSCPRITAECVKDLRQSIVKVTTGDVPDDSDMADEDSEFDFSASEVEADLSRQRSSDTMSTLRSRVSSSRLSGATSRSPSPRPDTDVDSPAKRGKTGSRMVSFADQSDASCSVQRRVSSIAKASDSPAVCVEKRSDVGGNGSDEGGDSNEDDDFFAQAPVRKSTGKVRRRKKRRGSGRPAQLHMDEVKRGIPARFGSEGLETLDSGFVLSPNAPQRRSLLQQHSGVVPRFTNSVSSSSGGGLSTAMAITTGTTAISLPQRGGPRQSSGQTSLEGEDQDDDWPRLVAPNLTRRRRANRLGCLTMVSFRRGGMQRYGRHSDRPPAWWAKSRHAYRRLLQYVSKSMSEVGGGVHSLYDPAVAFFEDLLGSPMSGLSRSERPPALATSSSTDRKEDTGASGSTAFLRAQSQVSLGQLRRKRAEQRQDRSRGASVHIQSGGCMSSLLATPHLLMSPEENERDWKQWEATSGMDEGDDAPDGEICEDDEPQGHSDDDLGLQMPKLAKVPGGVEKGSLRELQRPESKLVPSVVPSSAAPRPAANSKQEGSNPPAFDALVSTVVNVDAFKQRAVRRLRGRNDSITSIDTQAVRKPHLRRLSSSSLNGRMPARTGPQLPLKALLVSDDGTALEALSSPESRRARAAKELELQQMRSASSPDDSVGSAAGTQPGRARGDSYFSVGVSGLPARSSSSHPAAKSLGVVRDPERCEAGVSRDDSAAPEPEPVGVRLIQTPLWEGRGARWPIRDALLPATHGLGLADDLRDSCPTSSQQPSDEAVNLDLLDDAGEDDAAGEPPLVTYGSPERFQDSLRQLSTMPFGTPALKNDASVTSVGWLRGDLEAYSDDEKPPKSQDE